MIKKNIKGESLVGVILAVALLGFVILGIANMLTYSDTVNYNYEIESNINLIKDNTLNILKKLDISPLQENETFYLYKDSINKSFLLFTGTTNEQYKYIDKYGEKVNPLSFSGIIYERNILLEKKDIVLGNNIFKINVTKSKIN
nr:hypothetical protein [Candidatus Gracilibacteria bacterium]